MDKVTFSTDLDKKSCYIICKYSNAIEYQYFEPIFKSRQSSIDI